MLTWRGVTALLETQFNSVAVIGVVLLALVEPLGTQYPIAWGSLSHTSNSRPNNFSEAETAAR
jgi:hypothetical protein